MQYSENYPKVREFVLNASILALTFLVSAPVCKVVQTIGGYQVTYPQGKIGGSSALNIPAQYVNIPPAKEYYLDYQVRFENDFEWVKGGKLPGLVGGSHTSGCVGIVPNGWSARFMWHEGGAIDLYMYHQNRRSGCGDSYYPTDKAKYPKNKWVRITQRVLLNTPGVNDGMIEVWYNGIKGLSVDKVQLRGKVADNVAMIDAISLQTFYGGSSSSWAPPHTTHASFSTFYLHDSLPDFSHPFDTTGVGISTGFAKAKIVGGRNYSISKSGGRIQFEAVVAGQREYHQFDSKGCALKMSGY